MYLALSHTSRARARSRLIKGLIILNIYLVPLAAVAIYTTYRARASDSRLLLLLGILLTIASPLIASLLALATMKFLKLIPQEGTSNNK